MGRVLTDSLKYTSTLPIKSITPIHWSLTLAARNSVGDAGRWRIRVAEQVLGRSKMNPRGVTVRYKDLNQSDEVVDHGFIRVVVWRDAGTGTDAASRNR
ncbi:MAG: hypothetical protein OXN89_16270 [Bryobacterales bacterium]|nr:hypothetical protein [Bryobacterales bacterium]